MMELNKEYSYEQILDQMKSLQKKYCSIITMESIGITEQKRVIPMFILGDRKKKEYKQVVVTGGVHGRENINPAVLIKIAEDFCEKQITRPSGEILEPWKIYMIPLLNPDGYEIARKEDILWKGNAKGIDINRNFPAASWKKKFDGDRPESEPETAALIRIFHQVKPDGYIDYHSRGKSIFYYRKALDAPYNQKQKYIAEALNRSCGYSLEEPDHEVDLQDSGGNTVHYFSEVFRKPAITIETAAEEELFPLNPKLQWETFEEIKNTIEVFLQTI